MTPKDYVTETTNSLRTGDSEGSATRRGETTLANSSFRERTESITQDPMALELARRLDDALTSFDLSGTSQISYIEGDGAIVLEIRTPYFRLSFNIEKDHASSWWGLAQQKHTNAGILASGSLEWESMIGILGMVLPPRNRVFHLRASVGSENVTGGTIRG